MANCSIVCSTICLIIMFEMMRSSIDRGGRDIRLSPSGRPVLRANPAIVSKPYEPKAIEQLVGAFLDETLLQ